MNQEQIEAYLTVCVVALVERYDREVKAKLLPDDERIRYMISATFLSGVNATMSLVRQSGGRIKETDVRCAVDVIGKELGLVPFTPDQD